MPRLTETLVLSDGRSTPLQLWVPDGTGTPRGIVQLSHGMQEYALRYGKTAQFFERRGFVFAGSDHRGHGSEAFPVRGELGAGGFERVLLDLHEVGGQLRARFPGQPLFLLGHSWGSFLAQAYLQRWGRELAGAILSGSNGRQPSLSAGLLLAKTVVALRGGSRPAGLLQYLAVDSLDRGFGRPGERKWISAEPSAVASYLADPLCGGVFPNGFYLELLRLLAHAWNPDNERRIPAGLPVLLVSGQDDPVGLRGKGVSVLADRYRRLGVKTELVLLPGERHEIFDPDRLPEVLERIVRWLESV